MDKPFKFIFSNGLTAHAIQVQRWEELSAAVGELGLDYPRRTLVLVGGAGGMTDADMRHLRPLFVEALAPLAEKLGVSVVDGGTDAGVMRLMGEARAETSSKFPLTGVAVTSTVALPYAAPSHPEVASLEPHHTHFVLVSGSNWGDDSPWLAYVAKVLACGSPSVTVLINGGEIAREDVSQSVKAGRPVIVIGGSGRLADTLAGALRGESADIKARELAASGLLQAVSRTEGSNALAREIKKILSKK